MEKRIKQLEKTCLKLINVIELLIDNNNNMIFNTEINEKYLINIKNSLIKRIK